MQTVPNSQGLLPYTRYDNMILQCTPNTLPEHVLTQCKLWAHVSNGKLGKCSTHQVYRRADDKLWNLFKGNLNSFERIIDLRPTEPIARVCLYENK